MTPEWKEIVYPLSGQNNIVSPKTLLPSCQICVLVFDAAGSGCRDQTEGNKAACESSGAGMVHLGLDRFHQLMQVVMGWENTAPHPWRGWDNDFGDPRQFVPPGPQDERKASVADLFTTVGEVATYVYDFDAQWIHELLLTDVVAAKPSPILINGTGACPPESVQGAYAYGQFKLAIKDRTHPFWKMDEALMRSFQRFNPNQFSQQQTASRLECLALSWQRKSRRKSVVKSRWLVVIDNEPIRRKYRKELDQSRRQPNGEVECTRVYRNESQKGRKAG